MPKRTLRQRVAQFEARHLLGAATNAMGFVDDDQVPSGRDEVFEPFAVVTSELLLAPATAGVHWLDGIEGTDDLVVHPPEILAIINRPGLSQSGQRTAERTV